VAGLSSTWHEPLPASLEHLEKAVDYFESSRSGYVDFRVGPNPGVVAHVVLGLTQWQAGAPETAAATIKRALDLAAELDHPYSKAYALHHAGLLELWRVNLDCVAARATALLAIAEQHDYPTWRALALVLGGTAMAGSGEVDVGLARVAEGFELYKGLSAPPVFWPALLVIRAGALGMVGRNQEALGFVREAEAALQPGDPTAPDVGIAHGDLLLAAAPPDAREAEDIFERTARLAADRGARMAQLQALTRLAVLRSGTPAAVEARRVLRQVYDQFTEGFELPQLVAARAALGS
jgi:hypothetical protein